MGDPRRAAQQAAGLVQQRPGRGWVPRQGGRGGWLWGRPRVGAHRGAPGQAAAAFEQEGPHTWGGGQSETPARPGHPSFTLSHPELQELLHSYSGCPPLSPGGLLNGDQGGQSPSAQRGTRGRGSPVLGRDPGQGQNGHHLLWCLGEQRDEDMDTRWQSQFSSKDSSPGLGD